MAINKGNGAYITVSDATGEFLTGTYDKNVYYYTASSGGTWSDLGYADSHRGYCDLKVIRFSQSVADCFGGSPAAYGSAIFFGGADTRAYISAAYSSARVTFGGGSLGTSSASAAPGWYFSISATAGKSYSLETISSYASTAYGWGNHASAGYITSTSAGQNFAYKYIGRSHGDVNSGYTGPTYMSNFVGTNAIIDRGSWAYANNGYIDTGKGKIGLAGTMVVAIGSGAYGSAIFVTPSTSSIPGGSASNNEMFFFTQNGNSSSYPDAWTRVLTDRNTYVSNGGVTILGTNVGSSSSAPVSYASYAAQTNTLLRKNGQGTTGGYDLNTMLAGGGITSQYGSSAYWGNGPSGMSYGGAAELNTRYSSATSNTLNVQFAWDVNHNVSTPTRNLWFRTSNNLGWAADWKLLLNSTDFKAGVNYVAPQTTLGGYGITDFVVKFDGSNSPDTFTTSGIYRVSTQAGTGNFGYGQVLVLRGTSTSDTITQIAAPYNSNTMFFRSGTVSSFSASTWNAIYNSGNANKGDVGWTCSTLTARNAVDIFTNTTDPAVLKIRSSAGNGSAGYILFNSQDGRNGFKISAEFSAWAARQDLVFYSSNNTTDPYTFTPIEAMRIKCDGNIGMGTSSPSQKLHVVGQILSTGDQVISSDASLKTNLSDIAYTVEDISKAPAVTFDWKDGHGRSAGSIAQYWKPIIPELVHGEEGEMTLAYGQIAMLNSIILAKDNVELRKKNAELETRVEQLEETVKTLCAKLGI